MHLYPNEVSCAGAASAAHYEGIRLLIKTSAVASWEHSYVMSAPMNEGKITTREITTARTLKILPFLSFFLVSLPAPIVFFILFIVSSTTETAALYLFLTLMGAAFGIAAGLVLFVFLMLYRKRWMQRLRERLAIDGITASEVQWFMHELTTAERKTLKQMQAKSPLLADAYSEILASRLMASRVLARTRKDLMLVERRINRLASISGTDTKALQEELLEDRARLADAKQQATVRLAETQARMHMVEAAASRDQSHNETYAMLQRLTDAQTHLPLSIEMAQMEKQALKELESGQGQP